MIIYPMSIFERRIVRWLGWIAIAYGLIVIGCLLAMAGSG
jgi:hypothetical protein